MAEIDPSELASALKRLVEWAQEHAPEPEPELQARLREHFGAEPSGLPVVSKPLKGFERPNFQVALDAYLDDPSRDAELRGMSMVHGYRFGLAELTSAAASFEPQTA